jgi:hypothetical protein
MEFLYELDVILIYIFIVIPVFSDYDSRVINYKKLDDIVELVSNCKILATCAGDNLEEFFIEESLGIFVGIEYCGEFGHGGVL